MWNIPLFPDQASNLAGRVDAVFLAWLGICAFFTALIFLLIAVFGTKYRRGARVDRTAPAHASNAIEFLWIGVPLVISVVMFIWSTVVFFEIYDPPPDAAEVYVVGKQWMWYTRHPEGNRETNELHVPLGRPIKLIMTSQDVIHSFFVPAFRIKQDVVPGRFTAAWFRPTKVGKYHLFCAEYCGTNHSVMGGSVHVMEPSDYQRWLAGGAGSATMAKEGESLFQQHHCAGCHGANPTVKAPRLEGVFGRPVPIQEGNAVRFVTADDRYIRDSILLPQSEIVAGYEPVMPSYKGQIGEEDLLKILEYIKSIGPRGEGR